MALHLKGLKEARLKRTKKKPKPNVKNMILALELLELSLALKKAVKKDRTKADVHC